MIPHNQRPLPLWTVPSDEVPDWTDSHDPGDVLEPEDAERLQAAREADEDRRERRDEDL